MPGMTHLHNMLNQLILVIIYDGLCKYVLKEILKDLALLLKEIIIHLLEIAALAGTPHNIDRFKTAELLGFMDQLKMLWIVFQIEILHVELFI